MKCPHFAQLVPIQAAKLENSNAIRFKKSGAKFWEVITWAEFADSVDALAKALYDLGVSQEHKVSILAPNMPESFIVDFAAFSIGAITVPLYASSSLSQVKYAIEDASVSVIFVGEQVQYDIACELMSSTNVLKHIVVYNEKVRLRSELNSVYFSSLLHKGEHSDSGTEVEKIRAIASEDSIASIVYTSGTTGKPKGVIITHKNLLASMRIHDMRLTSVSGEDRSVSFLPMNHIFERCWCYFCFYKGIEIYVNKNTGDILSTLKEVRPTIFCAVPRFWEKVYNSIQHNIESKGAVAKGVFVWALAVGRSYHLEHKRLRVKSDLLLKISYQIANRFVFSKIKKNLGLGNANILPTAGAAMSNEIIEFFRSIGVPILFGYGLTETTATVACYEKYGYVIGSVGSPMPSLQVMIGEENEILVKGDTVSSGYYNQPEATKEAFTEDGFFRTGDSGELVNNHINLTERIKDLFKTSNGSYIAPQQIEMKLAADKYIDQVVIIGDNFNFVTAIIFPNLELLKDVAEKKGIKYTWIDELVVKSDIVQFYYQRVNVLQKDLASFEQVKKISLIPKGFTFDSGELTNTYKLRRAVIAQKYRSLIDKMYAS